MDKIEIKVTKKIDGLTIKEGAKAYCEDCWKYIGDVTKDKVGKVAERALKGGVSDA